MRSYRRAASRWAYRSAAAGCTTKTGSDGRGRPSTECRCRISSRASPHRDRRRERPHRFGVPPSLLQPNVDERQCATPPTECADQGERRLPTFGLQWSAHPPQLSRCSASCRTKARGHRPGFRIRRGRQRRPTNALGFDPLVS